MSKEYQPWEYEITLFPNDQVITISREKLSKIRMNDDPDKIWKHEGVSFKKSDMLNIQLLAYVECMHCHAFVIAKIYDEHKDLCTEKCMAKYHDYRKPDTTKDYLSRLNPKNRVYINDLTHFYL